MRFSLSTILLLSTWIGLAVLAFLSLAPSPSYDQVASNGVGLIFPGTTLTGDKIETEADVLSRITNTTRPFHQRFTAAYALNSARQIQTEILATDPTYKWVFDEIALISISDSGDRWAWKMLFSGSPPHSNSQSLGDIRAFEAYLIGDGTLIIPESYQENEKGEYGIRPSQYDRWALMDQ